MGFAGGIEESRFPFGHHRGHQNVFGGGHTGFIEEEHGGGESAVQPKLEFVFVEFDAQTSQAVEMRVEPPSTDLVSPWRVETNPPGSVKQGRHKEKGSTGSLTQLEGNFGLLDLPSPQHQFPRAPAHRSAQVLKNVQHPGDVPQVGDIFENHFLVAQQGRRDHGQHRVLAAAGRDLPGKGTPPLDHKLTHRLRLTRPGESNNPHHSRESPGADPA